MYADGSGIKYLPKNLNYNNTSLINSNTSAVACRRHSIKFQTYLYLFGCPTERWKNSNTLRKASRWGLEPWRTIPSWRFPRLARTLTRLRNCKDPLLKSLLLRRSTAILFIKFPCAQRGTAEVFINHPLCVCRIMCVADFWLSTLQLGHCRVYTSKCDFLGALSETLADFCILLEWGFFSFVAQYCVLI